MIPPPIWMTPRFLEIAGAVIAIAAYTGFIYYEGGKGPRAERDALISSIRAADDAHKTIDAQRKSQSLQALTEMEVRHAEQIASSDNSWSSYLERVRNEGRSGAAGGSQPVSGPPRVCDEPGGNERLLAALRSYRAEILDAETERKLETGQLFERASSQIITLNDCKAFVLKIRSINTQGASNSH